LPAASDRQIRACFSERGCDRIDRKKAGQNEIGIFLVNEVYYLRLLYQENEEKKLKALNVLEQDVVVKPKDRFICMGTVLGKVQGMPDL